MSNYNDHGDEVRCSVYENDKLTSETTTEYEYDEAGNYVTVKYYENGNLYQEDVYTENSADENMVCKSTSYTDYYYTLVTEYDAHGNEIAVLQYYDGVLIVENRQEFDLDEDGNFYVYRNVVTFDDNRKQVDTYNTHGDKTSCLYFTGEDQIEAHYFDYQYDEEGRTIYLSHTIDDQLVSETFYGVAEGPNGWYTHRQKSIAYNPDGTRAVEEYDSNEVLIKRTVYSAEGNVIG